MHSPGTLLSLESAIWKVHPLTKMGCTPSSERQPESGLLFGLALEMRGGDLGSGDFGDLDGTGRGGGSGHLPGVLNAVDDGDGGEDGENPEDGGHDSPAVEEGSQDEKDDTLRAFHEADLALADERLGASAGVADHERGDHDEGGEEDVKEPVATRVKNQKPKEENNIRVTVDDGVKEGSEDRDLLRLTGDAAVDHVEDAGADDDQAGVEEHAGIVVLVGEAEEDGSGGVDEQSDEGEDVGRDFRERKAIDDGLQENSAGPAKRTCPSFTHGIYSWPKHSGILAGSLWGLLPVPLVGYYDAILRLRGWW